MYRTAEKLQALRDKEKGIRLSPSRARRMEHSTKTSRKAQKPAGKQRPAETPADWQRGQQAARDRQKRRQTGKKTYPNKIYCDNITA